MILGSLESSGHEQHAKLQFDTKRAVDPALQRSDIAPVLDSRRETRFNSHFPLLAPIELTFFVRSAASPYSHLNPCLYGNS